MDSANEESSCFFFFLEGHYYTGYGFYASPTRFRLQVRRCRKGVGVVGNHPLKNIAVVSPPVEEHSQRVVSPPVEEHSSEVDS